MNLIKNIWLIAVRKQLRPKILTEIHFMHTSMTCLYLWMTISANTTSWQLVHTVAMYSSIAEPNPATLHT